MKPNNYYYREIAEIVTEDTYAKYYSSMYYMRAIAEYYKGESYTGRKSSNTYLKDFYIGVTSETVTGHHYNLYYLREIAKAFNPDFDMASNENQCLADIKENISVTPKTATTINFNNPSGLILVYGDECTITGTLLDNSENPIEEATVKLIVGTDEVSGTTNSSGVVSFTYTPSFTGEDIDFTLSYNGDSTYNRSSVTTQLSVGKETTVVSINNPSASDTIYTDSTITISGTLMDNDTPTAHAVKNKTLTLKDGDTTLKTLTVGNDGSYSDTITISASGSHTLNVIFAGDENYSSSSANVTVTVIASSINISASANPISYADSDDTTLTATVNSSDNKNKTITFTAKDSSNTTIDTYSTTTDNNGQATYTYDSQGAGDVTVTVECMSLQETFVIEDCTDYDPCTSNSGKWTIPSAVVSQYTSDGWRLSTSGAYAQVKLSDKLTSACSVEFTIVDYNTSYTGRGSSIILAQYTNGETTPSQSIMSQQSDSTINVLGTTINHLFVKGAVYRIEYAASTISVYENDVLLASASNNIGFPTRFEFHMGGNGRYAIYKDIKVKPL